VSNYAKGKCGTNFEACFTTAGNSIYSILIALWTTLLCESWKRKESSLANKWLVRDYNSVAFERKDYKAALTIDSDLRTAWKRIYGADIGKAIYLGIPISIFFAISVIGVAVGNRYLNEYYVDKAANQKPPTKPSTSTMMIPTVLYVGATMILAEIFKRVAMWLVVSENHRTQAAFESSLSLKRFIFDFVNSYVSLFFLAFWERSLAQLAQNLITFLVFQQVVSNVIEYLQNRIITAYKIRRVTNYYNRLIDRTPTQKDQLRL
jgi:hypothetical protein